MKDAPLVIDWAWLADHLGAIAGRTVQHLWLAAIAVAAGLAISFGLALWSVRRRRAHAPITALAGILYTIPSLALFAALVPITGISLLSAEIPLVAYTLLIFVRNIVAGFDSVPAEVHEAAMAMGYTSWQRLREIELPLAIPLSAAGLRIASVSTIGLVTVTGTLGDSFGGLGYFIFEGYHRYFPTEIYAGAVPSIILAVLVDLALVRLERRITPWAARPGRATTGRVGSVAGSGAPA
jgi:osmoprotectant transport system permease protein